MLCYSETPIDIVCESKIVECPVGTGVWNELKNKLMLSTRRGRKRNTSKGEKKVAVSFQPFFSCFEVFMAARK